MIKDIRKTRVNGSAHIEITPDTLADLDMVRTGDNTYHAIVDGISYSIAVQSINYTERTIQLEVNNTVYTLKIEGPTQNMLESLGYNLVDNEVDGRVIAPMPGLLLNILVEEGQSIEVGDHLCILEAMKMENILKSPTAGTVESILVEKGQSVNKGDTLISIQP